jgi:UDP-N-acetylglucosamine--N-acetylmuramyl-(pentapeptide) pyrophosphoryl-undecaprenol N-acetylglucosamine transferase
LSVSELAAVALPSILVPYPFAADDHQQHNAALLADAGGAVLIREGDLSRERLASALDALLLDPARREEMRRALAGVARRQAAKMIADDIQLLVSASGAGAKPAAGPRRPASKH